MTVEVEVRDVDSKRIDIPTSIVKAVCAVMAAVEAIKKDQRNQHGNYNFASTDAIYAAVAKKMGQVGLICLAMEGTVDIVTKENKDKSSSPWLKVVYYFVLATETDTFQHPGAKRTVMVQVNGPQTFQAAQSYCEKSFLRALFKLPTGDMDLDSLPENYEYQNIFDHTPAPIPDAPAVVEKKLPAAALLEKVRKVLEFADTIETLDAAWNAIMPEANDTFTDNEWTIANGLYHNREVKLIGRVR